MNDEYIGMIAGAVIVCLLAMAIFFYTSARADEIDDLIPSIIMCESNGNPNAVSKAGAIGLMQITPIVIDEWNNQNGFGELGKATIYMMYNPESNVKIGTWYLRRLKDHYLKDHYTIERMLAAYNGGITRLKSVDYDVNRMPKESREYVRKVMALYRGFIEILSN